jgi:MFS family permease
MTEGAELARDLGRLRVAAYGSVALVGADAGSVAYIMPVLRGSFGADAQAASWLVTLFVLGCLVGAPLGASLATARGDRTVLGLSCALFGISALLMSIAGGWNAILLGRLLQGLGAGSVVPLTATLVTRRWPAERHGRMLSALALIYGLAFVLQIALTPLLIRLGWRWIFAGEALVAAVLLVAFRRRGAWAAGTAPRWDLPGVVTWGGSLGCLAVGVNQFQGGIGGGRLGLAMGAAGLALAGAFVAVESASRFPMFPLAAFRSRQMRAVAALCMTAGLGQMAIVQFPSVLVARLGVTPAQSGAIMLPLVAAGLLAATINMVLLDRIGARTLSAVFAVNAVTGLLVAAWPSTGRIPLAAAGALLGLGVAGLSSGPLRYVTARAVADGAVARAQAAVGVLMNVGLMLGGALVGAVSGATADEGTAQGHAMLALAVLAGLAALPLVALRPHRPAPAPAGRPEPVA